MKEYSEKLPLTFKQSAAIFAFKVLMVEIVFTLLNFSIHLINDANQYFNGREFFEGPFLESLIFLFQMILRFSIVVYIVFQWIYENYEVDEKNISHIKGVLFRQVEKYPLRNIQSITINRGLVGKLFNFGDVRLSIPILGKTVTLPNVPYPDQFVDILGDIIPSSGKPDFIIK